MRKFVPEFENYLHIPTEHWREFYPANHGLRFRHLHYDDATLPHAKLWRSYDTIWTVGYHYFYCYRMAVAELRRMAASLADSADVYHCLDHRHLCPDTY